nr:MAG TPA: hypothetical protein [Caudoviricetes sp.]
MRISYLFLSFRKGLERIIANKAIDFKTRRRFIKDIRG